MSIALVRVDDRLIHGQVSVGWVQALKARRIALVDDEVRANDWEQELYRLGVPPGIAVEFVSVDEAAHAVERWMREPEPTIVLTPDVATVERLVDQTGAIRKVNVGGVHEASGRSQRLSYVYLSDSETDALRRLGERGVEVTAQDVPTARAVPLEELL